MTKEPDNRELAQQVELLKKDYEIMKTDLLATLETIRAENATIRAENAKRETRMILAVLGVMVAGITILGFILN